MRALTLADIGFGEAAPTRATLTLPEPPSANRWWRMVVIKGQARMLVSSEAREYKARVAQLGSRQQLPDGPVKLTIDWYRERKSGDLDKRIGVLLDALQGVLYANDSQVVELIARRHDDKNNPRVTVTAEAL
jgi:crossover junction endodeoxyribonuclease RusA